MSVHDPFRHRWCDSPVKTRIAEYPRPDHFLLHISDTHLLAGGEQLYGTVDSEQHLRALLAEVEASGGRPEAIVFTGDLADRGQPDAYARLRALVDPAAERMGARVIWVMGNHDDRASFRQGLRDEIGDTSPIDDVYWLGGLRVIVLDSTVPGHHYGDVSESQLDWLAAELAMPAPEGTILAMHHPPIPSVLDLAVSVELRDQSQLREVLEGSDVRSILAGHLHYSSTATFAGIPVSVSSASCYTQDLNVPVGGTRGRDGALAFNLVHVYPNTVLHSVVPLGHYPTLDYVDAEESARRLAEDGIRIPPAPRRETPTEPISVLA
ncbi:Calcineurin-like phosphoesterase [Leifsonia sp. 98AMF]|nr:Calcineurin-like phosphoesterase [Leifsonia sp. 197AMF]SDJ45367.1 Calcineurin-like phosphoesterase [Leifsonia sp. 466MF]SDK30325.1 Calcineurin-like phosphoesterase [Leifsonia sp. 157MF]SDN65740.1 Calcineurin-like phosphoesterase [Leifsonia sp. 509MF]SEN42910.1 Calcineurin-like phosphoesterase [Leifsonia sp. 467MF]SFM91702.1 Calcineurin-like phosphoesterase [Leifsonia sp. 98AMF]